jgi:hypothetical protein
MNAPRAQLRTAINFDTLAVGTTRFKGELRDNLDVLRFGDIFDLAPASPVNFFVCLGGVGGIRY